MLTLDLKLDHDTYPAATPVKAALTLRCHEAIDRAVNTRLVLNSPHAPAPFREILFKITGPSGSPVAFGARVNVGYPGPDDFKVLGAGETVEREYPLHRFYDLTRPGRYSLKAVYHNQRDPEDGRTAWKEVLESPVVSFEVVDAPQAEA